MKNFVFVLLLFGATSVSVSGVAIVALVGAAAAVVSAVSSVAYTVFSLSEGTPVVTCDILIENWTKWTLHDQRSYVGGGSLSENFTLNIPTAVKKKLLARKTQFTATGTYGVTSWQVGPGSLNRRVWVMWSVPFDRFLYPSNWLAVGISTATFTNTYAAYDQMYNHYEDTDYLVFNREFYQRGVSSDDVTISDSNALIVEGEMGTERQTNARIIVRPVYDEDLAEAIRRHLNGWK